MGLGEGGLELFVDDGVLAAALMGRADQLSSEFSVRLRGSFDDSRLTELLAAAAIDAGSRGRVEEVRPSGGEAANRWVQVVAVGLRPRDLKQICERCGIEANRIIRTRFGPIVMDRALARGVSRRLNAGEMAALANAAGLTPPRRAASRSGRGVSGPSGRVRARPATGSRKTGR
jgi:23S rRNA pseudouridine2605 synthase